MSLILFALLIFVLLYPLWVVHRQTLGRHERIERSPKEWGAGFEDIEYETFDGLILRGWWVAAETRKAVLLLHGNGGSRNGHRSGIFDLGRWYHERGFSVMMVDMRAHGESEGRRIYFGIKESVDLLGWVERIDPNSAFSWSIHGFSMGAATALMMKDRKPDRFERVVADAPWIDFHTLARRELWRRAYLPPLFYGYIRFIAKRVFDIDFNAADNQKRSKRLCGERILYIFESQDRLVTPLHTKILKQICPDAKVAIFDDVGHVEAFKGDSERYLDTLRKFFGP